MNLNQETKFIMKKYNITANKNYGQNFLIDENVVDEIINSSNITTDDIVIEIGPGLGTLTSALLEKAGKVICIELDKKMLDILNDRFKLYKNFELINDDILKVDLKSLINKNLSEYKNAKIVANLPYYITTPIIMKLLEDRLDIESITVMVQKEVAQRLIAAPGGKFAGAITYSVAYYSEPKKIIEVSNQSFIPSPEVDSEVIKLSLRKQPQVIVNDEEKFFKLIKFSFMQRRKTFLNGVSNSGFVDKQKLKEILEKLQINENIRGENLTLKQFAQIANLI